MSGDRDPLGAPLSKIANTPSSSSPEKPATPTTSTNTNSSSEAAVLQRLRTPHDAFMSVLSTRHKSLTAVRLMWPRENLRPALESAILMQDQAVFVDVLRVLVNNG